MTGQVTCLVNGAEQSRPVYCIEDTGLVVPVTEAGEILFWKRDDRRPHIWQGRIEVDSDAAV